MNSINFSTKFTMSNEQLNACSETACCTACSFNGQCPMQRIFDYAQKQGEKALQGDYEKVFNLNQKYIEYLKSNT